MGDQGEQTVSGRSLDVGSPSAVSAGAGPAATGEPEVLVVADVAAWRAWLDAHEDDSDGVWLLLARKGVAEPTSLTYAQALDEALCSGWIDGQTKRVDERTYRQRYTPRRRRSLWSVRNTTYVARLAAEGRMRARGTAEVERAKGDGRWDRAYAGPATMTVPEDLEAALGASPSRAAAFAALDAQGRYGVLFRLATATSAAVRSRRLAAALASLDGPGSGSGAEAGAGAGED